MLQPTSVALLEVTNERDCLTSLPLTLSSETRIGFGLWNSLGATIAVEFILFVIGLTFYLSVTAPKDNIGRYGLAGLITFLLVINALNLFGPPPPSVSAVAWSAQAVWLLVAWGYWVDRHRTLRATAVAA